MQLVIAEKPSVAMALSNVLGAAKRGDGYMEGGGWLVGWCVGHLVGLAPADAYDPRYSRWSRADLPILPEPWQYQVLPDTRKQFEILKSLMGRADVDGVVNACDAGREGELIFRLTYHLCGCTKPVKRLWISSMEENAIRDGFAHLYPGKNYDSLYDAALCRARADWLVGINGTRLFTTLYGGKTLNIGRVMTPTLALLTEREAAIAAFKSEKFYVVELDCGDFHAESGRFTSRTDAEKLQKSCLGKTVVVKSVVRREKTEKPPKLYDLTALQREANRLYGYTAQQTLDYIQLLYEKRLATYPRTDARYVTEDVAAGLPALCSFLAAVFPFASGFTGAVDAAQVTDSAKVSDHHALLPTKEAAAVDLSTLPTGERKVLSLIVARLFCAVCPEKYVYADTAVTLECAGTVFAAKSRVQLDEGWKGLERAFLETVKEKTEGSASVLLPKIAEGQRFTAKEATIRKGTTSPPVRYTEAALLAAMERAGNEDSDPDAERRGLGTPATRAGMIEKLVKGGFVERKGRVLIPTARGMELVGVLPDTVKSVKLTALWEHALKEVERGERRPEDFLNGVADMVRGLVKAYEGISVGGETALSEPDRGAVGMCPRCGRNVVEGRKSFFCEGWNAAPPCGFALWKNDRFFTAKRKELTHKVAAGLLKNGRVPMSGLYSEKKGVFYDATVVMEDTGEKFVRFKLEFKQKK